MMARRPTMMLALIAVAAVLMSMLTVGSSFHLRTGSQPLFTPSALFSTTTAAAVGGGAAVATGLPPTERQSLDVRIDDVWYDLSAWRKKHPAGAHWIDLYKDRDATEVRY